MGGGGDVRGESVEESKDDLLGEKKYINRVNDALFSTGGKKELLSDSERSMRIRTKKINSFKEWEDIVVFENKVAME